MKRSIPQYLNAKVPFSFDDLNGMPGGIAGAEIEAVASASLYYIEGYNGISGGWVGDKIFGPTSVANSGTGLVSAGIGVSAGVWLTELPHNLYQEIGAQAKVRCIVENQSPSYDRPYINLFEVHSYLRSLPPAGCELPESSFNPLRMFR